jgi:hypothetical protein
MRVSAEKERGATGAHLGRDEGFAVGAIAPRRVGGQILAGRSQGIGKW